MFTICGKKIFAFGGASSHDIEDGILDPDSFETEEEFREKYRTMKKQNRRFRVNRISWWKEELPNDEELARGRKSLAENNYEVDYVVTHCVPQMIVNTFLHGCYDSDVLTLWFNDIVNDKLKFTKWYFGHYHQNMAIFGKFIMLYDKIERVL